jgi:hypothetical protein
MFKPGDKVVRKRNWIQGNWEIACKYARFDVMTILTVTGRKTFSSSEVSYVLLAEPIGLRVSGWQEDRFELAVTKELDEWI